MDNNLNLTPEMLEQASKATSAAALLAIAQENGITLTAEESVTYYTKLHPEIGAISDEELDNVSGGSICSDQPPPEKCENCGWTEFEQPKDVYIPFYRWYCKKCHQPYVE